MQLYVVICEYDMGFNMGNMGVYSSEEKRMTAMDKVNWKETGADSWEDLLEVGLVELSTIEG